MNWKVLPLAALIYLNGHPVWADCSASLVTGIDVSASTGAAGMEMQLAGMGEALNSPAVLSAFQSQGCVRIAVFLWSEPPAIVVLPWTEISSAEDAANASAILRRNAAEFVPPTGVLTDVSAALQTAEAMLSMIPPTGRHVVNIVLDGTDNVGDGPQIVAARLKAAGVRINAVTFGPSPELDDYMRANVTNGFVLRIVGPEDFARTYVQKFRMDLAEAQ